VKGVSLAWLAFISIQTVQYERQSPGVLPPPKLYVGSAAVFTLLGAAAQVAPKPATYMAVALLVAAGVRNQFATAGTPPASTAPKPTTSSSTSSAGKATTKGSK
jgi:hypothetical protein